MSDVPAAARVLAREVAAHQGERIRVQGWVHRYRHLGGLSFIILRDRSGLVQCVFEGALGATELPEESVITVEGLVSAEARAPGGVEVRVAAVTVLAKPSATLPFELSKKSLKAGLEVILEHRAYGLRHPKIGAVLKVQAELVNAFREHLRGLDFTEVRTPKIVATGTEGGANLFTVQYFEQKAFLAQSPQLYKQMLVGAGYERVFEVGPAYRAEDHNTSRHLSEFTSLDVELGFIQSDDELMDLEESLLRAMLQGVRERCGRELDLWQATPPEVGTIPRIPVQEARDILLRRYRKQTPAGDLDTEGERLICQYVGEEGKGGLVFITQYPESAKPFYAQPDPDRPGLTRTFDLLMLGQEITSGGQRIHDHALLVENMQKRRMNPDSFSYYLEIFALGMPPHGGFALGAERVAALVLGCGNAREAAAFPRDRTRLVP